MDIPSHIAESIEAITSLHARGERDVDVHQRGIQWVTSRIGRPRFLYLTIALVMTWIGLNLVLPMAGLRSFDPPPWSWLQGIVGLGALFITTMVLITQNRQLKLSEKRERLDLEISLLTERKVAKAISLLEELRRDLPNVKNRTDPEAKAMQLSTDPRAVAAALDASIEAEVGAEENKEDDEP